MRSNVRFQVFTHLTREMRSSLSDERKAQSATGQRFPPPSGASWLEEARHETAALGPVEVSNRHFSGNKYVGLETSHTAGETWAHCAGTSGLPSER